MKTLSGLSKLIVFAGMMLCSALSFGQRVFTYQPTDLQTQFVSGPTVLTFSATTVITIQPAPFVRLNPGDKTLPYRVALKPPVNAVGLRAVGYENRLVSAKILKSNLDGELEAMVEIPATQVDREVLVEWTTRNGQVVETIAVGRLN